MKTPYHVLKHKPKCPKCKWRMRWSGNITDGYEYVSHCYYCKNCSHTITLKPDKIAYKPRLVKAFIPPRTNNYRDGR